MSNSRPWTYVILVLASAVGLVAFLLPFFSPPPESASTSMAHVQDAPLFMLAISFLCVVIIIANLTSRQMSTRTIAILGILTAVNAVLRAVPGPAGFSAVFFLLILCGYVYGATFGFLLGSLSLLASALIGGGVGPWLPFQMLISGWVGLMSGWLPDLRKHKRLEIGLLVGWGAAWGLIFGLLMNLWFWPYISGPYTVSSQTWRPGLSLLEGLRRYAAFYLVTSLWWDAWRAVADAVAIVLLGAPLLKVLRRFERALHFEAVPDTLPTERTAEPSDA